MDDGKLLTEYVRNGSEAAFGQIVTRHRALVYSACLRETGSPPQAEDAAQVVFLLLSRKAKRLRPGPSLAGWLFQAARFVAKDVRKQEARRARREEIVLEELASRPLSPAPEWQRVEPLLNGALSALRPADRELILLRFLEGLSLSETGAALGLSEDAARMRVTRAVEKMRRWLKSHDASVTSIALTTLLTTEAARPIPARAAEAITQGTLQAISASPTANVLLLSKGVSHTMKIIKVKVAALAACVVLGGAALPSLVRALSPHKTSVNILAAPTPLAENVTAKITLDANQHAFYSLTLPKGASMIVLDTRRISKVGNMGVSLSLNDKAKSQIQGDLKQLGQLNFGSVYASEYRAVSWCSLQKPTPLIFDLHNAGVQCQFWLRVIPIPSAVVVSASEASPSLAVPRFGDTLPKPISLSEIKAGQLEGNGTALFVISLKAGHYHSHLDFSSVSGKPTDLDGNLLIDDQKGGPLFNEEGLPVTEGSSEEINRLHWSDVSTGQNVSNFTLKKDGVFLITIHNERDKVGNADPVNFTEQIVPDDPGAKAKQN